MFHTLSYYTEHVTGKTEKTILDLTGVFCLRELYRDSGLQHAAYRLLGFHRWLPRAAEDVTEEHTVVLSLSKDLHLFCKFYRDLQLKKAQNHCFYTITITWKEISGIFPISTFKNDSAPSTMMHNYIFRVALLQPVYIQQELVMFNDLCSHCLMGLQIFCEEFCSEGRIVCSLRYLFSGI